MSQPALASREVTSMTVWPTIGATWIGRWVGALCGNMIGFGPFRLGRLLALAMIPAAICVYAWQLMPWAMRRYRITDRRIVILKGLRVRELAAVPFEGFDAIAVQVLFGQAWLNSGDLVFLQSGREVFRLHGVLRPDVFRQACLKAQTSYISVHRVLRQQAEAVPAGSH